MSGPSKIVPFAPLPVPAVAAPRAFEGYPRFAREFGRPASPPALVIGFGIPGGMRDERPQR